MEGWGCLLELFAEPVLWFLMYVVLLPVTLVLATPWVLLRALFGPDTYPENVKAGYDGILHWWERVGDMPRQRGG